MANSTRTVVRFKVITSTIIVHQFMLINNLVPKTPQTDSEWLKLKIKDYLEKKLK